MLAVRLLLYAWGVVLGVKLNSYGVPFLWWILTVCTIGALIAATKREA